MIIFGTNDGIYYLNLQELADATLELVSVSFHFILYLPIIFHTLVSESSRKGDEARLGPELGLLST